MSRRPSKRSVELLRQVCAEGWRKPPADLNAERSAPVAHIFGIPCYVDPAAPDGVERAYFARVEPDGTMTVLADLTPPATPPQEKP